MLQKKITDRFFDKLENIIEQNSDKAALLKKGLLAAKEFYLCL